MRRFLTACVLVALMLVSLGCCTTDESITTAVDGTIRDLRIIRAQVIPQIPDGEIKIGDKTWTIHGLWDNRIGAMIVRERSIAAGLVSDKKFSTEKVTTEEGVTKEPR